MRVVGGGCCNRKPEKNSRLLSQKSTHYVYVRINHTLRIHTYIPHFMYTTHYMYMKTYTILHIFIDIVLYICIYMYMYMCVCKWCYVLIRRVWTRVLVHICCILLVRISSIHEITRRWVYTYLYIQCARLRIFYVHHIHRTYLYYGSNIYVLVTCGFHVRIAFLLRICIYVELCDYVLIRIWAYMVHHRRVLQSQLRSASSSSSSCSFFHKCPSTPLRTHTQLMINKVEIRERNNK